MGGSVTCNVGGDVLNLLDPNRIAESVANA
jgi:hypothetical protein